MANSKRRAEANRNVVETEPAAHPIGVGVGATGGAVTGATVGSLGGPLGTAIGAAVGGIVGGLAGKAVAKGLDPAVEDAYWRENYASRPYVTPGGPYETYRAAYRHGWEATGLYGELNWDDVEPRLREDWAESRGTSHMEWDDARQAARDAFSRLRPDADYRNENR
jgi:hypothetical protein